MLVIAEAQLGSNVKEALDGLSGVNSELQTAVQALTTTISGKAQAQVVSYVGTGTYGPSNPCSITADFPIEVAIALGYKGSYSNLYNNMDIAYPVMVSSNLTTSYLPNRGFSSEPSSGSAYGKKFGWENIFLVRDIRRYAVKW